MLCFKDMDSRPQNTYTFSIEVKQCFLGFIDRQLRAIVKVHNGTSPDKLIIRAFKFDICNIFL